MGFRNRLTTAGAVDTTDTPGGPAVRIYNYDTPTQRVAVVEFGDGIAGDTPSRLTSLANLVPQNPGYTAQGGGFTLAGGSWNGVDAPDLALGVESAPAGGYRSVARLTAAAAAYTSAPWQLENREPVGWAGQNPDVFRNVPWRVAPGDTGGEMDLDGTGVVHLEALLQFVAPTSGGTFAPGSGTPLASLPSWAFPRRRLVLITQAQNAPATVHILPNGQVLYTGGPTIPDRGTVSIYTSYLSALLPATA